MMQNKIFKIGTLVAVSIILATWITSSPAFAFCPPTCAPRADYTASMMSGNATVPNPNSATSQQIQTTSGGTLNVSLETDPASPGTSSQTLLMISFINKNAQAVQPHIDYYVTVTQGNQQITGAGSPNQLLHTAAGSISIPIQFPADGTYHVNVGVEGIVFQPIPLETSTFSLAVTGQNSPVQSTRTITIMTDKSSYVSGEMVSFSGRVTNPYPGQDVAMKITNPSGNVVTASQLALDNNGNFASRLNTVPLTENGQYTIYVQQGDWQAVANQVQFQLTGVSPSQPTSNLQPPSYMRSNSSTSNPNLPPANLPPPAYMIGNSNSGSSNTNSGITITTDKSSYNYGDIIAISGTANPNWTTAQNLVGIPNPVITTHHTVDLIMRNSAQDVIMIQDITIAANGAFSTSIMTGGALWNLPGLYTVVAQQGMNSQATTFKFSGSQASSGPSTFPVDGTTYSITCTITNGKVLNIKADPSSKSLIMTIQPTGDGLLTITMPRTLIDDKKSDGSDSSFVVLNDGQQNNQADETSTTVTDRTLAIPFLNGVSQIDIVGTSMQFWQQTLQPQQSIPQQSIPQQPIPPQSNPTLPPPSQESTPTAMSKIPAWVKNIFIWYGRGSISDDELLGAIQFLVQQGIIKAQN